MASGIPKGGTVDVNTLKDEELLLRLRNTGDAFVERKLFSDSSDWLKTTVAFANSTPIGYPPVLFIGVKNDGTPEDRHESIESIMRSFGQRVSKAYPEIYYVAKTLTVESKEVLAIIIPGSEGRPHFTGPSFVRVGSESRKASEKQFERLLASRNSKANEILRWRGKLVTVGNITTLLHGPQRTTERLSVVDCNQFYVTLEDKIKSNRKSIPLGRIMLSYDERNGCLELEVRLA
jgi:Schlafen, AlbA_2